MVEVTDLEDVLAAGLAVPVFAGWLEPEQASRAVERAGGIVLASLYNANRAPTSSTPDDTRALARASSCPGSSRCRSSRPTSLTVPYDVSTLQPTTKGAVH
jgi:hypothetical protein